MADIPYTIRFSHRRTVGIHVHRDGSVEVRAPYGTPESTIRRIVAEKKDWIRDTVTRVIETTPVYTLHCLPDEGAARLSCKVLTEGNEK